MRNFYSVLCVAPKAGDAEIKSAFRNLAKTWHPDIKPDDREAEAAFQEAKRAYKFLSNPETRKVYDAFLASRRAVARRRLRRAAATMSVTFVLTATSVFLATVWMQEGGLPFAGSREFAEGPVRASTVEVVRASSQASSEDQKTGAEQVPTAGKAPAQHADAITEMPTEP